MAQFVKNNINYHGARSKTSVSTKETGDAKSKKGKKKNYSGSDNNASWDSRSNSSTQYRNNRHSGYSNVDSWDDNPSENSWANVWETNSRKAKDDNSWANSVHSRKKNSATIWDNIEQDFPAIASSQNMPQTNVWEERRRKREEINSIVPSSEDQEQEMLAIALEMSKLDVVCEDRRQRLETEYWIQETFIKDNHDMLKLKHPEFLIQEDFVSDELSSTSDNNWSSEGYATAAGNSYASTQSSHKDFKRVERQNSHKINLVNQNQIAKNKKGNDNNWDDTEKIASNNTGINNWDGIEDIVSSNASYDTWDDSEPSQTDLNNLASKEKPNFQKIESVSNMDNGIKKSKEWNNDTYSDSTVISSSKSSKCWAEPVQNNTSKSKIYDNSTNAFNQSKADDSSTQFKENTYKSSNKSLNSTSIHTNKASNVKISKVVDMFGGWGSSSDFKKPHISQNYEENVKTLTNNSNMIELGNKSNKTEMNKKDAQKSSVSSQRTSTVKKSISLNVENFKSTDAAQLDDLNGSENFTDNTGLKASSSLNEKCAISRDISLQYNLSNVPPESTEISIIEHELKDNSSKYIPDSSLLETSLSSSAIEKRKESVHDLNVSFIMNTSNQILDNQGNRSPASNFDSYRVDNTNATNSCPITYIASPKSVSTFTTADNIIHLDSESRDSIQPPIPPQDYESAASCYINPAEYIDPPFVPGTCIDSPKPAFQFSTSESINHPGSDNFAKTTNCTESTLSNEDFKMPDISPEISKFINPPNLLFNSAVNAPSQPVSGMTSEVNQLGQPLPSTANLSSESLSIPSYPMIGGMMNSMIMPGINPMMMMPGMNTILWQQMVFLSNPFFARQLQAMEMHYRSMGLPVAQQNQFPQQMNSVPNNDALFINTENSFNNNIIQPPSEPNLSDSIINPPAYSTDVSQVIKNIKSFEPPANEPDFQILKVSPESFEMEEAELLLNEFLPKKNPSVTNETPIPPPIQPPYYKDNVVPDKTTTSAQVVSDGLTASKVYAHSAAASLPLSNLLESNHGNWSENFSTSSDMMLESRESEKKNAQVPVTTAEIKSSGWGEIDKKSFSSNSNWDDDVDGWGLENYTTKSMGNPSNYDSRKKNINRQPSSQPSFSRFKK